MRKDLKYCGVTEYHFNMEKSYFGLNKLSLPIVIASLLVFPTLFAQDFTDDLGAPESSEVSTEEVIPGLLTEKIQRISENKKFFIVTNSSQGFAKGDFVSLIYQNKLTARALVAKDTDALSGIKILKIYSLDNWSKMRQGLDINILRGDDSYFQNELKKSQDKESGKASAEEEDLTDLSKLEDDLDLEEKTNRAIKTDNLLFAYYGYIPGQNADGSSASYSLFSGSWGYQLADNFWGEATLGQTVVSDYPSGGIDTVLTLFSLKFKYTIEAPFYSYLQPYVGYRVTTADSPGAGQDLTGDAQEKELELVEDLQKSGIIFGISFLKRLVPGWFIRGDVGTDTMAMGFGLEF